MELDKRIKDIGTIQTILHYDVNCIGCKGYFFDEFVDIKDLSRCCCYGELIEIDFARDQNDLCFKAELKNGNTSFFRFFIPEDNLKPVEKKYRPYTLAEWIAQHEIGDVIHLRSKSEGIVAHYMYMGYAHGIGKNIQEVGIGTVTLGVASYSLDYLFENYEIEVNGEWLPFGVIEDD